MFRFVLLVYVAAAVGTVVLGQDDCDKFPVCASLSRLEECTVPIGTPSTTIRYHWISFEHESDRFRAPLGTIVLLSSTKETLYTLNFFIDSGMERYAKINVGGCGKDTVEWQIPLNEITTIPCLTITGRKVWYGDELMGRLTGRCAFDVANMAIFGDWEADKVRRRLVCHSAPDDVPPEHLAPAECVKFPVCKTDGELEVRGCIVRMDKTSTSIRYNTIRFDEFHSETSLGTITLLSASNKPKYYLDAYIVSYFDGRFVQIKVSGCWQNPVRWEVPLEGDSATPSFNFNLKTRRVTYGEDDVLIGALEGNCVRSVAKVAIFGGSEQFKIQRSLKCRSEEDVLPECYKYPVCEPSWGVDSELSKCTVPLDTSLATIRYNRMMIWPDFLVYDSPLQLGTINLLSTSTSTPLYRIKFRVKIYSNAQVEMDVEGGCEGSRWSEEWRLPLTGWDTTPSIGIAAGGRVTYGEEGVLMGTLGGGCVDDLARMAIEEVSFVAKVHGRLSCLSEPIQV